MTKWKVSSLCASPKCLFCAFGPSRQYLGVVGNHPSSSVHSHSLMLTKFLCACHKFLSWCTLTLIGSIQILSTCEIHMEHMSTFMMWTLGHMHREHDFHWLEYESDGKKWFPPHLAMFKTSWWKSGPNNYTWLTSCGQGLYNGLSAHNHIHTYKTKFPFNQIKRHKSD
jgi:hypothetical protein